MGIFDKDELDEALFCSEFYKTPEQIQLVAQKFGSPLSDFYNKYKNEHTDKLKKSKKNY